MKFNKLLLVLICFLIASGSNIKTLKADEGMWLPLLISRLNYVDMQKKGLKLTAEEIYSVNHNSLKDAIIQLGNGCTGEIISPNGLILTNHHCGFGKIQEHSSINHDYLTDGFWARSYQDELPNPGFFVKFLIRIEDVSAQALKDVDEQMSETSRANKINDNIIEIKEKAMEGNHYEAIVKSFFGGNEYYLFVMETFKDIRLVGAPPSSIGNFGGDTDNWMWPRHTGDFSMFRIYTAPDGSPAEYSKENIPMASKYFLPISLNGVQKNDFAMILGYPGSTNRYLSSYGVDYNLNNVYPTRIEIRRKKLDIMAADMANDSKVRIQYASKYAGISNYWKNFIGMSNGLKRLEIADKKRDTERNMQNWINENPERKTLYGQIFKDIDDAYAILAKYSLEFYYYSEAINTGAEALKISSLFSNLEKELLKDKPDNKTLAKEINRLSEYGATFYKDFNLATDKRLFSAMMQMFHENVPQDQQPELLLAASSKFKNNFDKMTDRFYTKSIFSSQEAFNNFLNNHDVKVLQKDYIYQAANAFAKNHLKLTSLTKEANEKLEKSNRLYIDVLRKIDSQKTFYPDANFSMRLTYGKVLDYKPIDGVNYNYFTTLKGVMEKEDSSNSEFIVPPRLKEIYKNKDYGLYGEGNTMKVCFLTDNDITGGNSGSPVINGKGELIGLAFDGNWEAMSGDIAYEPELQRTISVDIRYVLLLIDKYAKANNLINEMTLVGKAVN